MAILSVETMAFEPPTGNDGVSLFGLHENLIMTCEMSEPIRVYLKNRSEILCSYRWKGVCERSELLEVDRTRVSHVGTIKGRSWQCI